MNKRRKPSTERNPGQRVPPRRTSNVSLRAANDNPKILSAREKSPQIVQVDRPISPTEIAPVCENEDQRIPKTRFTPQDGQRKLRSSSSPRLKSFPAEVIKADCAPSFPSKPIGALIGQQDPEESGAYFVADQNQPGHGDQMSQLYRRQMEHGSMGQQQVPPHLSGQMNPQFEGVINRPGIDKQLHHPYVPNVPHGMSVRDQTPRLRGGAAALPSHVHQYSGQHPYMQVQPTIELMDESKRQKSKNPQDEWITDDQISTPNLEKQPVGGRNAVAHRKMIMQDKQPQPPMPQEQTMPQTMQQPMASLSADSTPVVTQMPNTVSDTVQICQRSIARGHSGQVYPQQGLDAQDPRQVYSQLQQNIARQRQMQQNALTQQASMMNAQNQTLRPHGSYNSQPGAMTSPQDVTINQLKESRRAVDPNSNQYRQNSGISPQNGWVQDNRVIADHPSVRAQLKPFAIDLVNNNSQRQAQYQQYQQQQPQLSYTPATQYSQPPNAMLMQQTPPNVHQQQVPQLAHQQHVPQTVHQQQTPHTAHQQQTRRVERKKSVQFTPAMLHDQELLVATMRQQGISDDLMRRQFDTLLQEQRRQLAYIQQLHQSNENAESVKNVEPVVKKKSRIDEKPEWMTHLTPPRVSYDDIERMRQERYASLDRGGQGQRTNEAEMQEYNMQQAAMQQKMSQVPFNNQQNWPVQQMQAQPPAQPQAQSQYQSNAYQQWQQRPAPPSPQMYNMQQKMHGRSVSASALPTAMAPQLFAQQMTQYQQQPQYQMHTPQNNQYQMQQYQQHWQNAQGLVNVPSNPKPVRDSQSYDHMGRPSEPSSLLKLKVYKDFIKPQKRNNGLQDPDTVQKTLQSLQTLEGKPGYEYLAHLRKPGRAVKLNGTQDPVEMNPDMQSRYMVDIAPPAQKRVPSNGLENTRDPNNPPYRLVSRRKNSEEAVELHEYPRQRQSYQTNSYSSIAQKDNVPPQQFQQSQQHQQLNQLQQAQYQRTLPATNQVQPFRFESSQPQYYQQVQQFQRNRQYLKNNNGQGDVGTVQRSDLPGTINTNRAGGDTAENFNYAHRQSAPNKDSFVPASYAVDPTRMTNGNYARPEICEARSIGGVTFFARKPEYAPPNQLLQENMGPRYVQPLVMY